jgi:hypothetical protein
MQHAAVPTSALPKPPENTTNFRLYFSRHPHRFLEFCMKNDDVGLFAVASLTHSCVSAPQILASTPRALIFVSIHLSDAGQVMTGICALAEI